MTSLPRTVWASGFVSLFMDLSSELVHALVPLFMITVLGASMVAVGVVEGIAEATASIVKLFSGALSDRMRRRKLLVVAGSGIRGAAYGLLAASILAGSLWGSFSARATFFSGAAFTAVALIGLVTYLSRR